MNRYLYSQGFTFIELIIVFTVLVIIGTVGIASLVDYSHSQAVTSAALDIKTLLQQTRSNAISQVKPSSCPTNLSDPTNNSTLLGYEFDVCVGDILGRPSACKNTDDFEINAKCDTDTGTKYVYIVNRKYSSSLTITSTYRSYFFPVISAGVDHSGTVTVSGYGKSKDITITNLGVIE